MNEDLKIVAGIISIIVVLFSAIIIAAWLNNRQTLVCIEKLKEKPVVEIQAICGRIK